ncbi:MAG: Holliday junction resolvase RuvX [Robiginitomaculum sp.]|nr:Holliday junction resolvase RuvX [Robiginitomaculum sp.]MDQ7077398.1 Holliday junction resolvase RuvX [Robiginitomaculum sp.]
MAVIDIMDIVARGALLGLDPGSKTIGIAVSDGARIAATPLETVKRTKFKADAERVFSLYDNRQCVGIVVGMPINMDGTSGPRAQSVRAFAANLLQVRDVPLVFWDERLSTVAVERTLLAADTRRSRRKEVIDKMAAAYILQGALDRLR